MIVLNELRRLGFRDAVRGGAVLETQLDVSPQQATVCIDVVNHHPGHVRIGDARERGRTRHVRDDAHLNGSTD